jgi:uncharacterized protein YmfQ (DUF2313 family)
MGMSEDQYLQQLLALLPPGPAWSAAQGEPLHDLLRGWSAGLARVDAAFLQLIKEADPRTTDMLLTDWERVAGLPDTCELAFGGAQSEVQRRTALLARLISQGGLSKGYYLDVLQALGYTTATITEFREPTVDDDVDSLLIGDSWEAAWQINAPLLSTTELTVESEVDLALAEWGDALLECVLNRINRAGATLVFNYS